MALRQSRTRTLIQIGGLIEKSGLLQSLGIIAGDDLQRNPDCFKSAAILLGAFHEINETIKEPFGDSQMILWEEKGKSILGRDA
jgi:hypothetical protein